MKGKLLLVLVLVSSFKLGYSQSKPISTTITTTTTTTTPTPTTITLTTTATTTSSHNAASNPTFSSLFVTPTVPSHSHSEPDDTDTNGTSTQKKASQVELRKTWDECNNGWTFYSSKCYELRELKTGYSDAKSRCEKDVGSTLASVANKEENDFLKSLMTEKNVNRSWIGLTFVQRNCTGLQYDHVNCRRKGWRWEDGTDYISPGFHDWYFTSPKHADLCAHLDSTLGWIGSGCGVSDDIKAYLCEKEPISTTITTTTTTTTPTPTTITLTTTATTTSSHNAASNPTFSSLFVTPTVPSHSHSEPDDTDTNGTSTQKKASQVELRKTLVLVVIVIYSLLALSLIILVIEVVVFYRSGRLPCQRVEEDSRKNTHI